LFGVEWLFKLASAGMSGLKVQMSEENGNLPNFIYVKKNDLGILIKI